MTTTLATLRSPQALSQFYRDQLASQINRSSPTLNAIRKVIGRGQNVAFIARFGTDVGQNFTDGQTVSTFQTDVKRPATLNWALYGDAFKVTGLAKAGARSNNSPSELANLTLAEMGYAVERTVKRVNQDLFAGAGTGTLLMGLVASAGPLDTTGTYANIARADEAQWASNVLSNGGVTRSLSLALMHEMDEQIYEAGGGKATLIVTTPHILRAYGQMIGSERRYVQDIRVDGRLIRLDAGFTVLEFGGRLMIEDQDCPDGMMLFLDMGTLKISWLPPDESDMQGDFVGSIPLTGPSDYQAGMVAAGNETEIMLRVNQLARVGDVTPFQLISYFQLECDRPNANGVIKDLPA